ncbi:MAG: bifunctional 4-hydroxy-2-oxoglutarate aldolase/2-dehydro-3-deoxy-phosphogluconate aldolase [Firmicutes bacterium]|nr:bifunctional 4-hydroxy-2-oxoglutarate aldolase/2-dehydro-3-deoxy-phosphogluconate aldolase [Bacillota bacterium]
MTDVLELLGESKVIAIIRGFDPEASVAVAEALAGGGVKLIEVTFNSPGAAESIQAVARMPGVVCGAGTVLVESQVATAVERGARFIVAPNAHERVVRAARMMGAACIPGAMTPTEVLMAARWGADAVKVFPASVVGPAFFREMKGPLPHIRLVATGGITADNAGEFVRAGAFAVGMGGSLVPKEAVQSKDWPRIMALAQRVVSSLKAD